MVDSTVVEGAKFKLKDLGKKNFYKKAAKSVAKTAKSVAKTVQKSKVYKATGINKFLTPAKKKKKKKKPNYNLKPAASADYSDNILPPYVGEKFASIQKDIKEYGNALDGKPSSKFVSPAPIGKQYFFKTGVTCTDLKTGNPVDRYTVIDSRVGVKNEDGTIDNSIFASAVADFNQSTIFSRQPDYKETLADKCVPITIEPIDVYGNKQKPETRHVSVVDIQKVNDTQLGGGSSGGLSSGGGSSGGGSSGKGPSTKEFSEGFVTFDMERMNTGQQVFIYSASVLGLYLFFKAYHKI
jgi:uncharacterized membrane protein YgcG